MRMPIDARKQRAADVLEENNRQRWLVRNGHRAYGEAKARRVAAGGRAQPISRPSDLPSDEGERPKRIGGNRSSSSLGADLLCLGLLGLSLGFALIGCIWTIAEIANWIGQLIGGGQA